MKDRLGVQANVAVPGSITATIVVAALLVPAYEDWTRQAAAAAEAAVDDALLEIAPAPLRVISVHAETTESGRRIMLTMQSREASSMLLNDTIAEFESEANRRPAAWAGAQALRDRDGSMASGLANEDDLLRASVEASDLFADARLETLWIWFSDGAPLRLELYAPTGWTPLTELDWREVH